MSRARELLRLVLGCALLLSPAPCASATELASAGQAPSLADVLQALGEKTESFVRAFQDTACLERIEQRVFGRKGKPRHTRVVVYEYLFMMKATNATISIDEMRRERQRRHRGDNDSPLMITNGFPAAVLIFHPFYRSNFDYELVGAEKFGGRDALLVKFRQKTNQPNQLFSFRHGNHSWPVYVRGRAWIDARDFQVVALETEMIEPNPQAGLLEESTHIEYEVVSFKHRKEQLWLPKHVRVDLAWKGRRFQNEHTFSDYMAFNVETQQTIRPPEPDSKQP